MFVFIFVFYYEWKGLFTKLVCAIINKIIECVLLIMMV
jgi:hypothetical protein